MNLRRKICLLAVLLTVGVLGTWRGDAFALLGPFQSWMQPTNGLDQPGDIGGPMSLGEGYRWNVPVVTYGFDKSFVDFFGTNGEAAVESAIQILNNLPPASQTELTNYPFNSTEYNYTAQAESLYDLKSSTLPLLLEQMGLTTPTRYVFVLKQWNPVFIPPAKNEFSSELDWPDWVYPDYITNLNFDPQTLVASHYVNDTVYSAYISTSGDQNWMTIYPIEPFSISFTAVADSLINDPSGAFYMGLTRDDVGGIRYLLSTNNIAYETLLPGVTGIGTNANAFVNGAWRPGVDKITFLPQPVDPQSGEFLPMTNDYTDTYITNGVYMYQQLARVISKPDFLFCANETSFWFDRTGTTNWINNATLNGNPEGGGPGVIQPPVKITFEKKGPNYSSDGSVTSIQLTPEVWGSFDGSTNAPVVYPIPQTGTQAMTVQILLLNTANNSQKSIGWTQCSTSGAQYALQNSTDLINWATLFIVTNNSSICTFSIINPPGPAEFFRLQPINF